MLLPLCIPPHPFFPLPATYFDTIDHDAKRYAYTLQYGRDNRIEATSNFPAAGFRQIIQQAYLTNALLRTGNASLTGSRILHGLRGFPSIKNTRLPLKLSGAIGGILFPFGISFLLPIFTLTLVKEKEDRISVMMKMNGLKAGAYFASHYLTFLVLYMVSTTIFILTGMVFGLTIFTQTQGGVVWLLLFIWGNVQISLAFFFTSIFNKSRLALVVVFLLMLCSVIVSLAVNFLFVDQPLSNAYNLWPPFAFYRALDVLNVASSSEEELAAASSVLAAAAGVAEWWLAA